LSAASGARKTQRHQPLRFFLAAANRADRQARLIRPMSTSSTIAPIIA
jgi:hypothetical protein